MVMVVVVVVVGEHVAHLRGPWGVTAEASGSGRA